MQNHSIRKILSVCFIFLFLLSASEIVVAQTIIKDTIEIVPKQVIRMLSSNGSRDIPRPIFFRMGGTLFVGGGDQIFGDGSIPPEDRWKLYADGTLLFTSPGAQIVSLGLVRQWDQVSFNMGYPESPNYHCDSCPAIPYPQSNSTEIIGGEIDFMNYGDVLFNPQYPESYFSLFDFPVTLVPDSTQEAIPPDVILNDEIIGGNPFIPSPNLFIAPMSGSLKLQITNANTAGIDTLFMESPVKKFLLINPAGHIGDTIDCGQVENGDTIQFYLHSSRGIMGGKNLYPEIFLPDTGQTAVIAASQRKLLGRAMKGRQKWHQPDVALLIGPGGPPPTSTILQFEDWTDLDFDDLELSAEIVAKTTLTIVAHQPWTLWPTLPPRSKGESRGADRPGYNPKRSFTIQVTDGAGQPVANEKIKIATQFEERSGGHEHVNGDKALPQNKQGVFYRQGKSGNPLELTTEADGTAKIDSFLASQVSGKFLITAQSKIDTTAKDTVNLMIRVPGFVEFGTGDYWSLTGNTSTEGQNHPSNHWCTQKAKDSLGTAIQEFYEWTLTEKGGEKAIKLGVNDMGLGWGGVFEYPGKWEFGVKHSFHRIGLSVDIDRSKITDEQLDKLTEVMKSLGGIRNSEKPQIHYDFDGGN